MHKLLEKYNAAKAAAQTILDAAKADGERGFTPDEQTAFDAHVTEAKALKAQMAAVTKSAQDLAELGDAPDAPEAPAVKSAPVVTNVKERLSPGEAFVKSAQFDALLKQYPNGIPKDSKVQMGAVNVGGVKALLTDPHLSPELRVVAPVGLSILGLSQAITVVDDAPEVVKVFRAAFTSVAAVVAEGAAKPEATLTWTPETLNLATIAHHIPVTNQTLSHNAMMRSTIDTFLANGVRAKVETEVAAMLAAAASLQTQAFSVDLRTTIRKAVTKALTGGASIGASPTGILVAATDAETIDLESIANIVLQPGEGFAQMASLWRLPLVVSTQVPAGFAYVGDLRQIHLYARGGVQISTGWVNTQFTENEQTVLAETEAISTVLVGPAIVKADLTA